MTTAPEPLALPRSRARSGPYALRLLGVALLGTLFAYGGVSVNVAESVTRAQRLPVPASPGALARTFEAVTFRSTDGLALRGWFFVASP